LEALTSQLRDSTQQAEDEAKRLRADAAKRGQREAEAAEAARAEAEAARAEAEAARAEANAARAEAARRLDDARVTAENHVAMVAKMRAAMEAEETAKLAAQREANELRTAFTEAQHTVRTYDATASGRTRRGEEEGLIAQTSCCMRAT
jgi:hypothetical protein